MPSTIPGSSSIMNKRIPTIIGLFLLILALILGVIFIGDGLGVFAPRATPETTPKQIRVTNVSDNKFTVSFMTDEPTTGFVRYGTEEDSLDSQQTDDRNRISGNVGEFTLHHITVRNLQPNTIYFYVLGTGRGAKFDNQGTAFRVTTSRRSGTPKAARTIYGSVSTDSGAPAQGAVVYLATEGAGDTSSLVQQSGAWAIPLSDARTADGTEYALIEDEANLDLLVQGPSPEQKAQVTTTVAEAQPVPTISYGQTGAIVSSDAPGTTVAEGSDMRQLSPTEANQTEADQVLPAATSSGTVRLPLDELDVSEEKLVFDLDEDSDEEEPPVLTTTQPKITGKIEPGTEVKITVNSEFTIEDVLVTNEDGSFEIDVSKYGHLEPGEHTVTLEFINPDSGLEEVVTRTFYVQPQNTTVQLAQATPTPTPTPSATPFSTDSPFPIDQSATQGAGLTDDDASGSGSATGSGRTSMPSTASGIPVSGSIGTTLALIFGGIFFIVSGTWSFWVSRNYAREKAN